MEKLKQITFEPSEGKGHTQPLFLSAETAIFTFTEKYE